MDPRTAGRRVAGSKIDIIVTGLARLAGAGLLGAAAGIHLHLWDVGYRSIDTIGPLFLFDGVSGAAAALAVIAVPRRWLGWAAAAGAALQAGALGGLVLSLTVGLFGFTESTQAELVVETIWVESAGTVVLAGTAAAELLARPWAPRRRGTARTAQR